LTCYQTATIRFCFALQLRLLELVPKYSGRSVMIGVDRFSIAPLVDVATSGKPRLAAATRCPPAVSAETAPPHERGWRFLGLDAGVWARWDQVLMIVKPETVLAWHRRGFRSYEQENVARKGRIDR
jgi:hypothetical protein